MALTIIVTIKYRQ